MKNNRFAIRISFVYLCVGGLWIVVSDWLSFEDSNISRAYWFATVKGLCYVFATSVLLYLLFRRSFRMLGESEARFRVLVECAPDAAVVLKNRRIVYANTAAKNMLGTPSLDVFQSRAMFDFIDVKSRAQLGEGLLRIETKRESVRCQEITFVRWDGQTIDCEGAMAPILFDHAECVLIIVRDLTDRKLADEQKINERKMELVQQMAGGLAHELNNLTQVVNGNAELLGEHLSADAKAMGYVEQILCAGRSIADWVARITDFSISENPSVERMLLRSGAIAKQVFLLRESNSERVSGSQEVKLAASPPVSDSAQKTAGDANTVLFAEDDDLVSRLTAKMLALAGYEVLAAKDGLEAVDLYMANAEKISVVLLDIIMPRMNGFEAYSKIRARNAEVPVLFASGFKGYQVPDNVVLVPGVNFLAKPYNQGELMSALRQALAKRKGACS